MSEINIYRAIEDSKHFLDFLNKLIPRDEVEQIYNFYQKLRSRTFNGNYKLSYSEQCNLVLDKFGDSVFFSESSFLPEHLESLEQVNSNNVKKMELFVSDDLPIPLNIIKFANYLFKTKECVEGLLNDDSISSQQKELFRQCYSGKTKIDIENFRVAFPTLENVKEVIELYYTVADKEQFMKQPWSEVSTIQSYRDAKAIHDIYENVYELCLVSRNEKYDFYDWYIKLDFLRFCNVETFHPYYAVIGAFILYQRVYSNEWSDYLFYDVKCATCQAQDKIGFIRFLNSKEEEGGSRFAGTFVEWLEGIQINNEEILLDTKIIKQRTSILHSSEGDSKWYEEIPSGKIKEKRSIIECLDNLYNELIKKEWIPQNTNKELFIYRLSGQKGPYDMSFSMEWTTKNATLGKLIRCLYATSDTKPPFKKIQQFFGIDKKVNLAGADSIPPDNKTVQDIIQLLESCGFKM